MEYIVVNLVITKFTGPHKAQKLKSLENVHLIILLVRA